MASNKSAGCPVEATESVRTGKHIATAVVVAVIAGCQAEAGKRASNDLHDVLHRYVMASPLLDDCIEEHGLGPENRFEMMLEIHPSGELVPLEVTDGNKELNSCLKEKIPEILLPKGIVADVETISISIR